MDMDSTAIQIECIDEIAKLAGTGELVAEVTERAMRGELDFTASLRQRVATLKGPMPTFCAGARRAAADAGLTQLVLKLETLGWKVAIASGGFTFFADYLRDKLHLTTVVANELEIMDGKLTGKVIGDIVDAQYKANTLTRWRKNMKSRRPDRRHRRWRQRSADDQSGRAGHCLSCQAKSE
jgi:phosphoserine phosphatase